uniref:Uncharacterized protein n=1 Tax=Meloidogyne enterolobii TaxID=390850 RepID=A0A6V7WCB1_MELEN|nr:unnamed protein product [Meloidogyne enterolobii]
MSAYALGSSPSAPIIRVKPVQLRPRTLADLSNSFTVGFTSPIENTTANYKLRSFPYRTFRQSRLDDISYSDNYFQFSGKYRPLPLYERYERLDYKKVPYTYWSKAYCDCLYISDQPDNYRRIYEPYRDDYSYKVWSAPRRKLLKDV